MSRLFTVSLFLFPILLVGCNPLSQADQPKAVIDISEHLTRANHLAEAQQYSAALQTLAEAQQRNDTDARLYASQGQIYASQHRWPLAEDAYRMALTLEANQPDAIIGLSNTLLAQNKVSEAMIYWQQAIDQQISLEIAWQGLAQGYLINNDYTQARVAFAQVLTIHPTVDAQWAYAVLTFPENRNAARESLKAMPTQDERSQHLLDTLANLSEDVNQAEANKLMGVALVQLNEWSLAHHLLTLSIRLDESDAETWAFLGYVESNLNLPAADSFQNATKLMPELALIPYFEGLHFRQQGQLDEAIDRFLLALDLDPNNLGVALETAHTLAQKGDYLSAEAWYQSIVELEPETPFYQQMLTTFYIERSYQVADKGLPAAERLLEIAPQSAVAHYSLGWAKFQTNDPVGAEIALRQAITLDPNSVTAHYYLGRLLHTLNRDDEAQQILTFVIDHDTSGTLRDRVVKMLE
ncbi:MAG: tetratricopeptide repeat protein [Chloroflexota bacterium]